MPFTPFHFGVGLLFKSASPRYCSFVAFAATQVLIDVETLYHILSNQWPLHRFFHSLLGGLIAGLAVATALGGISAVFRVGSRHPSAANEVRWQSLIGGGVLGGLTHSVLDALFHSDVRLFYPLGESNALHGVLGDVPPPAEIVM